MNIEFLPPAGLSDDDLLAEVARLAASERAATVRLIAALTEVDSRRLYLGQGCSSLFVYCTTLLRLSEHAAYGRIEAARAARRFPVLLEMLAFGELTLTSLCLVAPHLTLRSEDVLRRVIHDARTRADVGNSVWAELPCHCGGASDKGVMSGQKRSERHANHLGYR